MPNIDETTIATKVRGVTRDNRQHVLREMHNAPEKVRNVIRQGLAVIIMLDSGMNYTIGFIDEKYQATLHNKITKIHSWKITGGYALDSTDGQYRNKLRANFGLNLVIKIVGSWDEEKSEQVC